MMKAGKRKPVCWFRSRLQALFSQAQHLRFQHSDGPNFLLFESEAAQWHIRLHPMAICEGGGYI